MEEEPTQPTTSSEKATMALEELKKHVIKLRTENRQAEAIEALKLYKKALAESENNYAAAAAAQDPSPETESATEKEVKEEEEESMEGEEVEVEKEVEAQGEEKEGEEQREEEKEEKAQTEEKEVKAQIEEKEVEAQIEEKEVEAQTEEEAGEEGEETVEIVIDQIKSTEIPYAQTQIRLFTFYQRFVNTTIGTRQLNLWNKYVHDCETMMNVLGDTANSEKGLDDVIRVNEDNSRMLHICQEEEEEEEGKKMDEYAFVGPGGAQPSDDNRLEIAVFSLEDILQNKSYQRILKDEMKLFKKLGEDLENVKRPAHTIRVDVSVQVPPPDSHTKKNEKVDTSSEDSSRKQSIDLTFGTYLSKGDRQAALDFPTVVLGTSTTKNIPSKTKKTKKNSNKLKNKKTTLSYKFGPSQFIDIPRGTSHPAKSALRRMARKKIILSVYHTFVPDSNKSNNGVGSLFKLLDKQNQQKQYDAKNRGETLLGRIILDLNLLLNGRYIAGEFPLMDTAKAPMGGKLRVGIRTNLPYDPRAGKKKEEEEEEEGRMGREVDLEPFEYLAFRSDDDDEEDRRDDEEEDKE